MAETNGNEPLRNEPARLSIENDMRQSYLDYAMSVNIGRALPDLRDGLKPVHRRILYAMFREVLPAQVPNLLINGSDGIAVGMATNIPPHNLSEVCDALLKLIENPDLTMEELLDIIPGPDFPTGGQLLGRQAIRQAYLSGRGS